MPPQDSSGQTSECPLGNVPLGDGSPRLEPQTADRGTNSENPDPYRPNPWQRREISCPVEGMGPHRTDCIYQDPRGFGQATAQQRTSKLGVNLCLSITQAAGLTPPLNGQREKTSEDTLMGKHPGGYYSVCRTHTPQKGLKGGRQKG